MNRKNFKKWASIQNHYRPEFIMRFFERFKSQMPHDMYVASEKIDGSNFSIIFDESGDVSFAKRSSPLQENESFFDYKQILKDDQIIDFIEIMKEYQHRRSSTPLDTSFQFVGELFGPGINGRVYYGSRKQWRWFAIYEDGRLISQREVDLLIDDIQANLLDYDVTSNIYGLKVPKIDSTWLDNTCPMSYFNKWIESLNIQQNSFLTPLGYDKPNLMEGVVIRPYYNDYVSPVGEHFIVKYKNEKFLDNHSTSKKKKAKVELPDDVTNIFVAVREYVNENRTMDLFSKYGKISDPSQIGDYIKWYAQDVFDDAEKDIPELNTMDKQHRKFINKAINKDIIAVLKENM